MKIKRNKVFLYFKKLYRLPKNLPAHEQHAYVINNYIFSYSFMGHFSFIPVFYYFGNEIVLFNNVACIFLDLLLFRINSRGWIRTAQAIWLAEISYHAFVGGIAYGWLPGFPYYLMGLSCFVFFSVFHAAVKIVMIFILYGLLAILYFYTRSFPPMTVLVPDAVTVLHFSNALASFAALGYACYYYIKVINEAEQDLKFERNRLKLRNEQVERELVLARKIQQQYIPATTPGDFIHAIYCPMEQVGGDFFDYIRFTDSERIGIFISDVSGHGVPAAFITSMLKTVIMQAGREKEEPACFFSYLNGLLYNQTGGNFITAFYGIYHVTTGRFVYSNAGHNPPLIILDDDVIPLTCTRSLPLAVMSNPEMEDVNKTFCDGEVFLQKNTKLLFYTDGLTEARSFEKPEMLFEYNGMYPVILAHKNAASDEFIRCLFNDLKKFRGTDSFEDDVCILCLDIK